MNGWRVALGALMITSSPVATMAAPASGPTPAFTGSDLFGLAAASDPKISPDGRHIAYVRRSADIMTDKIRSAIWLVDVATGQQRPIAAGSGNHFGPAWSPDGRSILFSAIRKPDWEMLANDSEIYRVSLSGGEPQALTSRKGADADPRPSPDGRSIAYVGSDDRLKGYEQSLLYVMDSNGGGARLVAPGLDRSIDNFAWSPDNRSIIASYEEAGRVKVSRISLDGRVSPIASDVGGGGLDRPYAGGSFSAARNGTIAFTRDSPTRPAELMVASGGKTRQLTRLNELTLSGKNLGTLREIAVTAPDGGKVPSWILLPPGHVAGTPVPTILEIHGGPYAAYGPGFSTDYQLYAAAGYAVLYTNPRGSSGYGQAFADGIEKTYPGSNYEDLMAAVDAAVAGGYADSNNLFVTGGSGGGILTAWIIGKTNRLKAAASQKPVINWTSMALTSDNLPFFGPYWIGGMPWDNQKAYWERSPLSLMANVKTPTLVVVGSEDYRTPVSESEQLYAALKLAKVPTMLVKVPEASHSFANRPSHSAAKAAAIIAWFDKYRNR